MNRITYIRLNLLLYSFERGSRVPSTLLAVQTAFFSNILKQWIILYKENFFFFTVQRYTNVTHLQHYTFNKNRSQWTVTDLLFFFFFFSPKHLNRYLILTQLNWSASYDDDDDPVFGPPRHHRVWRRFVPMQWMKKIYVKFSLREEVNLSLPIVWGAI